jgi:hypothetical protein
MFREEIDWISRLDNHTIKRGQWQLPMWNLVPHRAFRCCICMRTNNASVSRIKFFQKCVWKMSKRLCRRPSRPGGRTVRDLLREVRNVMSLLWSEEIVLWIVEALGTIVRSPDQKCIWFAEVPVCQCASIVLAGIATMVFQTVENTYIPLLENAANFLMLVEFRKDLVVEP